MTATLLLVLSSSVLADWSRFRGPNGTGVADSGAPTEFSKTNNLKWQVELPGRGFSSPIVVGDKVFVTCYSGYGMGDGQGELGDLKRHLVCVDRQSGETLWTKTIKARLPEDEFRPPGVATHGYASHTPVSDGERVYAFFGRGGVYAFDRTGLVYVIAAKPEYELLATNDMTFDASGFAASPAINDGQLFMRSNTHLYCIAED